MVSLSFLSCGKHQAKRNIAVNTTGLRDGDLIFREGPSLNSKFVKSVSDSQFSHVGIVYKTNIGWYVVHAVPDESQSHKTDTVKCEPIGVFLEPSRAISYKFIRVKCSNQKAKNAAKYAIWKADSHTLFDNDYDLKDTNRMYCTELVWQAYKRQDVNLITKTRRISFLGKTKEVIFPIDIIHSSYCDKSFNSPKH